MYSGRTDCAKSTALFEARVVSACRPNTHVRVKEEQERNIAFDNSEARSGVRSSSVLERPALYTILLAV